MPDISRFYGIIIRMFYRENSPPHFHATYQGMDAEFDFDGNLIIGNLKSKNAKHLIREWALLHKEELMDNWQNGLNRIEFNKIEPLD